jgi:hypothetical protein
MKMIFVFDYSCSGLLPNKDEEIDIDYQRQIGDQRLVLDLIKEGSRNANFIFILDLNNIKILLFR